MPLVFSAMLPHGFPLIPDLSDDAGRGLRTRATMEEVGRQEGWPPWRRTTSSG
ncbi:MAG: hypothetical protein IT338_19990 [Thermomicrobiales bacterium]|nr:hypothetical protein [Thermomicrobiales bacterium]